MFKLLSLCLLAILFQKTNGITPDNNTKRTVTPNYYDLALQKCHRDSSFSLHGLWPEYNASSWPQFCNKTEYREFNPSDLEQWDRFDEMNQYWFSCESESKAIPALNSMTFWKHEWEKHGTCTSMNVTEYFGKALDLFNYVKTNSYDDQCCQSGWMQCLLKFDKSTFNWEQTCKNTRSDEEGQRLWLEIGDRRSYNSISLDYEDNCDDDYEDNCDDDYEDDSEDYDIFSVPDFENVLYYPQLSQLDENDLDILLQEYVWQMELENIRDIFHQI
jgi:hypothetical protein